MRYSIYTMMNKPDSVPAFMSPGDRVKVLSSGEHYIIEASASGLSLKPVDTKTVPAPAPAKSSRKRGK